MYSTLTYDEWEDTYKPEQNKFIDQNKGGWQAYETYGEELDYVLSVANDPARGEQYVWTEVDGDNGVFIINGYHLVNRIQYYICEVPNALPKFQEVIARLETDCDCLNEDGDADPDCVLCESSGYMAVPIDTREDLIAIYGEEYANERV